MPDRAWPETRGRCLGTAASVADERLIALLREWGLEGVSIRAGGLAAEQDWESLLSLGEQQLLACIRVLLAAPRYVLLDRPGTALGGERVGTVLARFSAASIGYVHLDRTGGPDHLYDRILDIRADGRWGSVGDRPERPAAHDLLSNEPGASR